MVRGVAEGYFKHLGWSWDEVLENASDNAESDGAILEDFRAALDAIAPVVEKLLQRHTDAGYELALMLVRDRFESDGRGDYWWIHDQLKRLELPK